MPAAAEAEPAKAAEPAEEKELARDERAGSSSSSSSSEDETGKDTQEQGEAEEEAQPDGSPHPAPEEGTAESSQESQADASQVDVEQSSVIEKRGASQQQQLRISSTSRRMLERARATALTPPTTMPQRLPSVAQWTPTCRTPALRPVMLTCSGTPARHCGLCSTCRMNLVRSTLSSCATSCSVAGSSTPEL